jgi:hypothetical protein
MTLSRSTALIDHNAISLITIEEAHAHGDGEAFVALVIFLDLVDKRWRLMASAHAIAARDQYEHPLSSLFIIQRRRDSQIAQFAQMDEEHRRRRPSG